MPESATSTRQKKHSLGLLFVLWTIRLYQRFLSPDTGIITRGIFGPISACRFQPTCSVYMQQAIERYGVKKGVTIGIGRLRHCHPWGNYD